MNKMLHFNSSFKAISEGEDLIIEGMASTDSVDRTGDVVSPQAWVNGGIQNFMKNPVILFNHNYDSPIGRALDITPTQNGLKLRAKISKAAGPIVELIKDGVLGAFSIGFMVKDADYNSEADIFVIKSVDLLEVSVVSVPANQDAIFSISKQFSSDEEYSTFKSNFVDLAGHTLADKSNDAPASTTADGGVTLAKQEKTMDDKDFKEILAQVAKDAAREAAKEVEKTMDMREAKAKAAEETAAADLARKEEQKASVISAVRSGAQDLLADVEKRFHEKGEAIEKIVEDLRGELKEKADEIQKMRESKISFSDRSGSKRFEEEHESDIVDAHILGVITRKGWGTNFAKNLLEKAVNPNTGVTVPTATSYEPYELIVSTSIERDIQLELVLAPLFREIQMNAASMIIPTMPDTGYATFTSTGSTVGTGDDSKYVGDVGPRSEASPLATGGINMGSKVLTVRKMISKSYIANETEEDAIIPVLPLIRESIVRAHARAVEHQMLLGGLTTYGLLANGFTGLCKYAVDDSKAIDLGSAGGLNSATAAALFAARAAMGNYGYNPRDVVYIVSLTAYYDLINDPEFQNLNEVGSAATKLRGELGQVFGTPVIVSDAFPSGKTQGAPWGVAVNTRGFVIPRLRGLTVEQDYSVEGQYRTLVATQRFSFDRMFSTAGQVVSRTW